MNRVVLDKELNLSAMKNAAQFSQAAQQRNMAVYVMRHCLQLSVNVISRIFDMPHEQVVKVASKHRIRYSGDESIAPLLERYKAWTNQLMIDSPWLFIDSKAKKRNSDELADMSKKDALRHGRKTAIKRLRAGYYPPTLREINISCGFPEYYHRNYKAV